MNMLLLKWAYIRVVVKVLLIVNFANIYGSLINSSVCNITSTNASSSIDASAGFLIKIDGTTEDVKECNDYAGIDLREEDAYEDVGSGKLRVGLTVLGKAIQCGTLEKIEEQINVGKADGRRRVILRGLEYAAKSFVASSESLDYLLEVVGREAFEVSRYQDTFESIIKQLVKRVGYINNEDITYRIVSQDGSKREVDKKSEYKSLSKVCMAFLKECSRHRELLYKMEEMFKLAVEPTLPRNDLKN